MTSILACTLGIISVISCLYCAVCLIATAKYLQDRKRSPAPSIRPSISLLKPLKGTDPEMYQSLRSHCVQQYDDYEIVFGVNTPDDPALASVRALQHEFPACKIRVVVCDRVIGSNRKVSNLAQMTEVAAYDFLVINDGDIRVAPQYLSTIASELESPEVGLVTCLYAAVPGNGAWSKVESLGISTDFVPGILVAKLTEGRLKFALGSTMALRKSALERIGGFAAIADYLADDYQLGARIASSGLKVELSRMAVQTFLPNYYSSNFVSHQLRWARTIRSSRPAGYAGLPLTFTFFWALLTLAIVGPKPWAAALFLIACVLRGVVATTTAMLVLRDRTFAHSAWLLPFRDLLAPIIWLGGLVGNKIEWRGERFELRKGKLIPL